MKQLTPRQGTKTTSTQACVISYEPWKQLTPRQGTKTNCAFSGTVTASAGNNLRPVRGRKLNRIFPIVSHGDETTYAPSGDENALTQAAPKLVQRKQLTPRQGTKPRSKFPCIPHNCLETTYTPSGDENVNIHISPTSSGTETTYTPPGDEKATVPTLYVSNSLKQLTPRQGTKTCRCLI